MDQLSKELIAKQSTLKHLEAHASRAGQRHLSRNIGPNIVCTAVLNTAMSAKCLNQVSNCNLCAQVTLSPDLVNVAASAAAVIEMQRAGCWVVAVLTFSFVAAWIFHGACDISDGMVASAAAAAALLAAVLVHQASALSWDALGLPGQDLPVFAVCRGCYGEGPALN